ncbi:MAG: hypothetical protein ACYS1C_11090, partial [Planctomycetota bacterium]|jgi:hypothetical protein
VLRYGELLTWNPKWFSGSTTFMSHLKECLLLPLALALDPLRGTQLAVYLLRLAAAMTMYAGFARYFRAPAVGLICGYAYAFCMSASYSNETVDVMFSYLLFPLIFAAAVELLRRRSAAMALVLGVLIASEFCINLVHALVAPVMVILLLLLRPWRSTPSDDDPVTDRRLALRWAALLGLALVVFLAFAASQIAWFALDEQNHSPYAAEHVREGIFSFSEPSPFTLFNRANWLGDWLETHRPPDMVLFDAEVLRNQRHYMGFVALVICAAGWFAARTDFILRRSYQLFALLFLLQWWVAMGPRSLIWQVARTFAWPERLDQPIVIGLALASGLCLVTAGALWTFGGRRMTPRLELRLGLGLLLGSSTFPLFMVFHSLLPFLAHFRAPGKYMDLLPFPFFGAFGLGLLALSRALPQGRVVRGFLGLVLALVVIDFWPARAAFERGSDLGPVREFRELVAELPSGDNAGRLATYGSTTSWIESSLIAVNSKLNTNWGWLPWQGSPYSWPYFKTSFIWLGDQVPPKQRRQFREIGHVLSQIGRFRYALNGCGGAPECELDEPWQQRGHNERFALWEQPSVLPPAFGYRSYVVTVSNDYLPPNMTVYRAHKCGMAVLAGGQHFADLSASLVEGASLVIGLSESALSPAALFENPELARIATGKLLDRGAPDFKAEFSRFFSDRPVQELLPVDYRRPAPERIHLEIEAGSEPAVVFVSEAHHPWWRGWVDGESTPVLRAEMMFMAVRVGPGRHSIEMRLEPPVAVRAADGITSLAWVAAVAAGAAYGGLQLRRRWSRDTS